MRLRLSIALNYGACFFTEPDGSSLKDTWIYVEEQPDVLVGRLQIFNNWSPFMVADPTKVWIGLEYFCYETDKLWNYVRWGDCPFRYRRSCEDRHLLRRRHSRHLRCPRPQDLSAYFGPYKRFDEIIRYADQFQNLFLVGRNGMHKYNNQDHSMLTAMTAVDQIVAGKIDKSVLWQINTEQEYHEKRGGPCQTSS